MQVSQLMSKKVEWISPTLSLQEAARKMRDLDIGCLPVGENDRLVGMITDRDIACRGVADGKAGPKTVVRDAMSAGISYCFNDQEVSEAAHLMEEKQIRRLPVLNRQKRMVGMLSMGDISQHASGKVSAEVLKAVTKHGHATGTRTVPGHNRGKSAALSIAPGPPSKDLLRCRNAIGRARHRGRGSARRPCCGDQSGCHRNPS